ncbi:MAG: hypothetical protein ACXABY_37565 [Candidatus Thorarchaeota archaeon]
MSITGDIFSALKTFLVTNLTQANWVTLGYIDERADNSDETSYPIVVINLYDISFGDNRRVGGFTHEFSDNGDGTSTATKVPIPVNYHFQVDTVCNKQRDAWEVNESLSAILGKRSAGITINGKKLYMINEDIIPVPGIEGDDIYRTSFRFHFQAWLVNPDPSTIVNQVLSLEIQRRGYPASMVEVTS